MTEFSFDNLQCNNCFPRPTPAPKVDVDFRINVGCNKQKIQKIISTTSQSYFQLFKITDLYQKIPLDSIQLRLGILGQDLDVVAENHDREEPTSSEQHGDIAVDGVTEGQHDDIRFKLREDIIKILMYR